MFIDIYSIQSNGIYIDYATKSAIKDNLFKFIYKFERISQWHGVSSILFVKHFLINLCWNFYKAQKTMKFFCCLAKVACISFYKMKRSVYNSPKKRMLACKKFLCFLWTLLCLTQNKLYPVSRHFREKGMTLFLNMLFYKKI
jgi:hypothetical protein